MPDAWFQFQRESTDQKPVENIRLYRCLVHQPLDDTWQQDPDRLSDQAGWTTYITEWGVLAESEDDARETALRFQEKCYHLPAMVPEILESEESYTDIPGAVWQAGRFELTDEDPDDDDDSQDDDDDDDDLDEDE